MCVLKKSQDVYMLLQSQKWRKVFPEQDMGQKMKHRPFRICDFFFYFTIKFNLQLPLHSSTGHSNANKALTFTVSPKCSQLMEKVRKRTLYAF